MYIAAKNLKSFICFGFLAFFIFSPLLSLAITVPRQIQKFSPQGAHSKELIATLNLWTAECHKTKGCLPPRAFKNVAPLKISIPMKELKEPGESAKQTKEFLFVIPNTELKASGFLHVYNIFPHRSSPYPKHHQIQVEWKEPALSRCMISVKDRKPLLVPPLICSGPSMRTDPKSEEYEDWGLTITFPK